MRDLNDPKIRRFPRLLKDYPNADLPISLKSKIKFASGYVPKRYNKLTKRQKRLARMVVDGETVKYACKRVGTDPNTYYRYMRYHKLFKAYYLRYAEEQSKNVEGRLDAKFGRAIRVVEEAMDGPDPYHRHEAAVKLLQGRGKYRKAVDNKNEHRGAIDFRGTANEKPVDADTVELLAKAMMLMATGGKPEVKPKFIDVEIVKELPPPTENVIDDAIDTKVQEAVQAKSN